MQVVLISPYGSLVNVGLRVLSACLLQAGYDTRVIWLPSTKETASFLLFDPAELYDEGVVDQVVELCADASLVGITVMTNYFFKARQLTEAIHQRLHIPVVWGGIHPTICPEECMEHADMVCVGEGEQALVELAHCLAEQQSYAGIGNLWCRAADGTLIRNLCRPLIQDLDALPLPDYGPDRHYVLHDGRVQPLTPALLSFHLMWMSSTGEPVYALLATRGCPHRCSYCANDAYADLYPHWQHVRRRSNASLIAEIQAARDRFPFIREIAFLDDVFVAATTRSIEDFARLYKAQVGLPFYCVVSPLTINEAKLVALLDAGLVRVSMGIETGSPRIQQLYNRPMGNAAILAATRLLHTYAQRMLPPVYDVITDNPYEQTQDQLETLHLLAHIPRPYALLIFSLVFYPGTELYEKALADGLLADKYQALYSRNYFRIQPTFYNLVIYGFHRQFPPWLLRLASQRALFGLLNAPMWRPLMRLGNGLLMRARVWYSQRRLRAYRRRPLLRKPPHAIRG